jgi:hypothetical protein
LVKISAPDWPIFPGITPVTSRAPIDRALSVARRGEASRDERKIDRTAHTRPKMSARSTFKQEHPLGAFVDAAREPG